MHARVGRALFTGGCLKVNPILQNVYLAHGVSLMNHKECAKLCCLISVLFDLPFSRSLPLLLPPHNRFPLFHSGYRFFGLDRGPSGRRLGRRRPRRRLLLAGLVPS